MPLVDALKEGVKVQVIGFCCSNKLKTEFSRAIAERGEYNTYTSFFLKAMADYVKEWKEMKTNGG